MKKISAAYAIAAFSLFLPSDSFLCICVIAINIYLLYYARAGNFSIMLLNPEGPEEPYACRMFFQAYALPDSATLA